MRGWPSSILAVIEIFIRRWIKIGGDQNFYSVIDQNRRRRIKSCSSTNKKLFVAADYYTQINTCACV
jgi:hypothetical protein